MMHTDPRPTHLGRSLLYGLGAVALWSTVATAFKLSLNVVDVLPLLLGAAFFSTMILGSFLALRGELKSAIRALREDGKRAFLQGLMNPALYYVILFEAYDRLPAQVVQPINYSWALSLSLLGAVFLRQPLGVRGIGGLVLGYVGVLIISVSGFQLEKRLDLLGVGLAFLSSLLWAGSWLLQTRDDRPPIAALFQNFVLALPVLGVGAILLHDGSPLSMPSPGALLSMAYVGAFEMGFSFVLFQQALKWSPRIALTSSLTLLTPGLSLFVIHFVLREPIQPLTPLGLGLILAGLLLGREQGSGTKSA